MTVVLGTDANTPEQDVKLLHNVFLSFRSALKTGNPVGTNREITRALSGRNRMGLAYIAPDHPAINERGQLCDRWGSPYFFHQHSAYQMGIRSAGPDKEMYTEDDLVREPQIDR